MKKLFFFIFFLMPMLSRADHGAGVDIFYTHMHDSTYRISMIIYGNCTDRTDYLKLFTLHPQVDVYDNTTRKSTLSLDIVSDSTRDASPYCQKQLDSTSCTRIGSLIQGFTRIYYTDTIVLPYRSAKWIFKFNGSLNTGCSSRLGRPGSLANYVTVPAGVPNNMTVDAVLNNLQGNTNSSPRSSFSSIPLYCVNVPGVFSQQTTDPNGDSLVYEIFTPRNMNSNCVSPINLAPVNGYNPLHVVPGTYNFDPTNGRVTFTPDISQMSIIAIRISEYRNGVLVGSIERERILKILGNCNNQPPVSHIDTTAAQVAGATFIGQDTLFACPGNEVKFNIPVSNPFGDTVTASVEQIISGSNVVIMNNKTTGPTIKFVWNTIGVANGVYTFYARFFTNSCPLPSTSLTKYTIVIGGAGDAKTTVVSATNCVSKAAVRYDLANGRPPYEVTITKGGNVVSTYTSTTGIIEDSLEAGGYHVKLVSQGLPCVTEMDFNVVDSGVYPVKPTVVSPINYCRNAEAKTLIATSGDTISTLTWYDPNNQVYNSGVPVPPTNIAGTTYWYVSNKYKTCESNKDSIQVVIDQAECDYDVTVYNVITPNGDGKNDRWMVKNTQYYPSMLVQVFNKLGDKVYERRGYNNEWDGDNLPSGTYYYVVRLNGVNKTSGKETYTGYLLIKR